MKRYSLLALVMVTGCTSGKVEDNYGNGGPPNDPNVSENDAGVSDTDSPVPKKPDGYCESGGECESKVCSENKCQEASPTDGVMNADESDKDCGGLNAPKCGLDKGCVKHSDCESDACGYKGKCVADKGCTVHFGGDTCGEFEIGDPRAKHESCCKRIQIPSGAFVDKFKTTAARMRVMLERTNGDVKGWYLSNRASLRADAVDQLDPFIDYLPEHMSGGLYDVDRQLGSYIYILDQPSKKQGCTTEGTGTHTYWLPREVNEYYGDIDHGFPQEVLDTKPIQCLTMPMAMALCAWEGGRLQTFEENQTIFGSERFPWGLVPEPGGYRMLNGAWTLVGPADLRFGTTAPACPTCDDSLINWTNNYQYPIGGNPLVPSDFSYFISAPGRFPRDEGPFGHKDVSGDLIEMSSTKAQYIDKQGRAPTFRWGKQSSWEGHVLGYSDYAFYFLVKYGKTGQRCTR